jgi:hypothetical protein
MTVEEENPLQPESPEDALNREFEQQESTFPGVGIDLCGFESKELAQDVGNAVGCYLSSFGKLFNLKRLSRVIVAYDYNGALAGIDRGIETSEVLTPTQDEIAVGIAMTPAIIVNGELASVMVLNAAHLIVLAYPEKPELKEHCYRMAHVLAHECGHVHDLDVQARAFPNVLFKIKLPYKDEILFRVATACWGEYIASRLGAFMGSDLTIRELEDTFCAVLERAKADADKAIRQYRMHGDVSRVAREVTEGYKRLLVYASYLLGHLAGLEGALEELAPKAVQLVERTSYFEPLFRSLQEDLRAMHSTYGYWETIAVFEPLKQLAEKLFEAGGLQIQSKGEGAYITIPFTPDTTPSFQEMLEFRQSKMARAIAE